LGLVNRKMAAWSSDGPEELVQNVSVGEDIWQRSIEVDMIKLHEHIKELDAKLLLLKFQAIMMIILLLLSFIAMLFYLFW
jgi:hypothetical protein